MLAPIAPPTNVQLQQSVLGDEHPTVLNTIHCIEQVEQAESSLDQSRDLFSSWKSLRAEGWHFDDPDLGLSDLMTIMSCFTLMSKSKRLYPTKVVASCGTLETSPSSTSSTQQTMTGHEI